MKSFKLTALVAMLMSLSAFTTGCGKKSSDSNGGGAVGGSAPGYYGTVTTLANGSVAISFSGTNVYNSGIRISGGQVTGASKCAYQYCYCDYTSQGAFACWTFANAYSSGGSGTIAIGDSGLAYGQPGTIVAASKYEPNSGLTLVTTPGTDAIHSNIAGYITLSPQYMALNFPSGLPAIVSIAFDVTVSGGTGFGGVLIYTSQDASGYHGRFLRL